MSLIHAVTIRCNGCGTTYRPPTRAATGADARTQAALVGWSTWDGKDQCAACGPVRYRTKRPRGTCTVCSRDKPLTDQGVIYQHPAAGGAGRPFGWCDGGERPPAQEGTR